MQKSLHRLPITAVTQADVAKLLNNAAGPTSANRLRSTLSAMFSWVLREGVILPRGNPATFTHKREERARDRVLADHELKAIWQAWGSGDHGNVLRLLILTGARASEVSCLKWSEVREHFDAIELPAARVKNGRAHIIPLSKPARAILAGIDRGTRTHVFGRDDSGFWGFSKCKGRIDKQLGSAVAPWRIHDARRTAASGMQRLGVRIEVIERALNHVSGSFRGVAGVYARDPLSDDVRAALEKWGAHVVAVVEGRDDTRVVPLKRA
jgi:integrase